MPKKERSAVHFWAYCQIGDFAEWAICDTCDQMSFQITASSGSLEHNAREGISFSSFLVRDISLAMFHFVLVCSLEFCALYEKEQGGRLVVINIDRSAKPIQTTGRPSTIETECESEIFASTHNFFSSFTSRGRLLV